MLMSNEDTNNLNSRFWDELCGTNIARVLGVNDDSAESLGLFDKWFFDFYPYLQSHLAPIVANGGRVIEVGLGYGSVATFLMSQKLDYTGLDIASGPVEMANLRASRLSLKNDVAVLGNVLDLSSFKSGEFDTAVAIGSLHHTGDFDTAVRELIRTVRPGGVVVGMVYSLFSLRNWCKRPRMLISELFRNYSGTGRRIRADEDLRWMSDHNSIGEAAPATEYFTRRALRNVLSQYGTITIQGRNLDSLPLIGQSYPKIRIFMMRTPLARILGLDLYFKISKPIS
jgi:ubiquinone/menaquinone biosynthesis C-methylase UbiE